MRKSNLKFKIIEEEAQQIANNADDISLLTIEGVTRYTKLLTPEILKEMRERREGPAYFKRKQSIVYPKEELDKYLAGLKIQPDALELLDALFQPTLTQRVEELERQVQYLIDELSKQKTIANLKAPSELLQIGEDKEKAAR